MLASRGSTPKEPSPRATSTVLPRDESAESLALNMPSPTKDIQARGGAAAIDAWSWADDSTAGPADGTEDTPERPRRSFQVSTLAFPGRGHAETTQFFNASATSSSRPVPTPNLGASSSKRTTETDTEGGSASASVSASASNPRTSTSATSHSPPRRTQPPKKGGILLDAAEICSRGEAPGTAHSRGHSRTTSAPLYGGSSPKRGLTGRDRARIGSQQMWATDSDEDIDDDTETAGHGHRTHSRDTAMPGAVAGPRSVGHEKKASLGSRSYTTFRNIAAAWVPGGSRITSPQATPQEGRSPLLSASRALVALPSDSEKQLAPLDEHTVRKPLRLDRRRLDKAVGLAVEAAQAAEEDERAWKEKQRRRRARNAARAERQARLQSEALAHAAESGGLLSRIRTISEYSGLSVEGRRGRFNSLPWRGAEPRRKSIPYSQNTSAEPSGSEGSGLEDAANEAGAQSQQSDDDGDSSSEEDNFSLSLYLSSLSYLLSALPSKDAGQLPAKEREELTEKLRQVLKDIGVDPGPIGAEERPAAGVKAAMDTTQTAAMTESQREERLRELLEMELRRAEARMLGQSSDSYREAGGSTRRNKTTGASDGQGGAKGGGTGNSNGGTTLAGSIATATLELTFAVAAAGVGLVGSGLSRLQSTTPTPESHANDGGAETESSAKIVGEINEDEKALLVTKGAATQPPMRSGGQGKRTAVQRPRKTRGLQWDLAMALASTTASALYSSLSEAAQEAATNDEKALLAHGDNKVVGVAVQSSSTAEEMPEDRLVAMSAAFARSLKRSPLPSQLSSLSSQLLSLLHTLDERYELRKRATDEALRRTRQGLGFVRRRGWHVNIVRGAWALMEMSVAGVEAWREEGEELDDQKNPHGGAADGGAKKQSPPVRRAT
ncbi:unnamed protein product [Parajaminaea phylloscopi]